MKFNYLFFGLLLLLFTSQAFAITDTNLVSYWNFDEASGNLKDQVGSNDGTNTNVTQNQTGLIDKAYTYNTTNSHTTLTNVNTFIQNSETSVSVWVYPTTVDATNRIIWTTNNNSTTSTIELRLMQSNANLRFWGYAGSYQFQLNTDVLTANAWSNIVTTMKDNNVNIYINGVWKAGDTSSTLPTTGATASYFGLHDLATENRFAGKIDETGVWSRILTQSEIAELYNSGSGLTYPFDVNQIYADFDYVVTGTQVDLNDTSIVDGDAVIDSWEWLIDDVSSSTDQNYSFTGVEATDYNVCLIIQDTTLSLIDSTCQTISISDLTPPVTTFSSFQVPNTTDQNIILTCTDDNTGCKYINYIINDLNYLKDIPHGNEKIIYDTNEYIVYGTGVWNTQIYYSDYNNFLSNDINVQYKSTSTATAYIYLKIIYYDDTNYISSTYSDSSGVFINQNFTGWLTNKFVKRVEVNLRSLGTSYATRATMKNISIKYEKYQLLNYIYSFLYSGAGSHSIQYFSTDNSDNNETTKTSNFTTYGNGRFTIKDQNSGLDLNGTQINFNGSDYVSGTNIYDFNLQELTATNTSYLFTISKTGYSTRYYQTDLNYFSSFDINFALLPDSLDADVPFKVYETDETTLFTNTYVEVKDSDTNWTIGRLKTNSSGEATFNLRADDSNYNAIINNGEFTYIPVTVSVLYPKNEETLAQITEKWKIEITQNLYASYSDLNATKIIYLLPNTSLPYNIKISDMNGNYFPRTYAKTYPGNPLTDTLQPYLVLEATGLLTTINAISATTNQPLEGITFKVYKYISGLGRTFVEQLTTDSKGQALSLLVLGDSYEFEAYNGSVLLKNFPITATSSTIFFVLSLGSEVITQPGNSGFSSKFTPGNIINLETIGSQGFSQTLYNFGDKNITIASTITQNGVNLAAPQNYSGSSDKTFTYTVAWAGIVKGTIIQRMVVTTSDGNVYIFDQNIQVIESYGTGYNPIDGLQNGLRQDLTCSSDPLVPCYPLLVLAFLICVGVTIWATVQFGVYGGQSAGLIFLVGMILFTYLTWIPVWVTAGLVLIILAFIVNERR